MYLWDINSKYKEPPKEYYTEEENKKLSQEFREEIGKLLYPQKENPEIQGNF